MLIKRTKGVKIMMENKILLLILLAWLTSCGHYKPSERELAEKAISLSEVKALHGKFQQIPGLVVAKYPGTQSDYILFRGNYLENVSQGEVRYYSNLPGVQACNALLQQLTIDKAWDTTSHRGECRIREIRDYFFSSIDARKKFPGNLSQYFSVSIDITEHVKPIVTDNANWATQIEVRIIRSLDYAKFLGCFAEVPPEEQPCKAAVWYEG